MSTTAQPSTSSGDQQAKPAGLGRLKLHDRLRAVGMITVIVATLLNVWPPGLAILIMAKCLDEYYCATSPKAEQSMAWRLFFLCCATAEGVAAHFGGYRAMTLTLLVIELLILVASMLAISNGPVVPSPERLASLAVRLLGPLYVCFTFAHGILLLPHKNALTLIVFNIIVTAGGENGGLFVGAVLGTGKPVPNLSPQKTWAGFIAQPLTSVLFALPYAWWSSLPFTTADCVQLGLLLGTLGVIGDLFESFLKRCVGIKDMGDVFPGWGGALDRFDGLLFTYPALFYYVYAFCDHCGGGVVAGLGS